MNFKSTLVTIFFAFAAIHFAYGGSFADDAQTRRNTCGGLVKPHDDSSSSSSSQENSHESNPNPTGATDVTQSTTEAVTELTDSFTVDYNKYNCNLTDYLYELSVNLTGNDYQLWIQWIELIKIKILSKKSLSDDQKIVEISFSLKAFFEANLEIKGKLSYAKLGVWGSCQDLVYVGVQIQIEVAVNIVTLDSKGDCALFDALRNCSAGDSEKTSEVEKLIAQITAVLKESSWSYTQQQGNICELLKAFFSVHVDWQAEFYSYNIAGFGSLESYVEVTKTYNKITNIKDVIGGDSSDCALIKALRNAATNSSYPSNVRPQINQLNKTLTALFDSNVDISIRLSLFVEQYYSFCQLSPYLFDIISQIECGENGETIYDIVFASGICTNCGCGNIDDGPGTVAPATTTPVPAETSTQIPANCKTVWSLFEIDQQTNTTYFTTAIDAARLKWSASYRSSFNTYWNKIRVAIWSGASHESIFEQVISNCTAFNANNAQQQAIFFSVTITEWIGTVGDCVKCQCNCS